MAGLVRRLVAGTVVAGALLAIVPSAEAEFCRIYVIAGRVTRVCLPIEG